VLIIGLFDGLQTLLGAVYAYPGGWLTDHWGLRRSLLLFNALSLAGYVIVLVWQHWLALVLGVFLFLAWSALSLPATFAVVATSLDKRQHTMGVGVQSMIRRVPMMVGPLVGGWLITRFGWEHGVRLALFGCIALNVATALFQWCMAESPTVESAGPNGTERSISFLGVVKSFNPTLRELLVSDILIRFCERLPYAFVILWAMDYGGVTAEQFGWLVAIEETLEDSFCAELVGEEHHGMAFGTLATVNGVGDFLSSIIVGALWTAFGTSVAFSYSAVLFLAGAGVVSRLGRTSLNRNNAVVQP
jgi:MFS family permease